MNTEDITVECQDVVVKRFVWKDGNFSCGTGDLLCSLLALTETDKDDVYVADPNITEYLQDKGLIEHTVDSRFKVVEGQEDAIVDLGNTVSDMIDTEMNTLPVGTDVRLTPAVQISKILK